MTCVGHASYAGATTMKAHRDAGLRGVGYQQAFGPDAREADAKFDAARAKIESLRPGETPLDKLGLSPHAP